MNPPVFAEVFRQIISSVRYYHFPNYRYLSPSKLMYFMYLNNSHQNALVKMKFARAE